MPEAADLPAKPRRTWLPMILWTTGILLALGLAWFVGAVVVPVWQVWSIIKPLEDQGCSGSTALEEIRKDCFPACELLGGPVPARRKLCLYLALPVRLAPGRATAVAMLGDCDSEAVPILLDIHARSRGAERTEAAWALCNFDDRRAIVPLLELLESESNGSVGSREVQLVRRLGKFADPLAMPSIMRLLARRDGEHSRDWRILAAEALGNFRDARVIRPLLSVLREHYSDYSFNGNLAESARGSLRRLCGAEFAGLASGVHLDFTDQAREAERLRDPLVFELLCALIEERGSNVREDVALLLGFSGDPRAFEPLLAALRDKDWANRSEAAYALGGLADARGTEPLTECLVEADKKLRRAAAWALGATGPAAAAAIPALETALADPDADVRSAAAEALKKIRSGEAAPERRGDTCPP